MDILYLRSHSVTDCVRERAIAAASAPAIVSSAGQVLTYGELLNQTEYIGRVLLAAGVTSGDRVALIASNGPDMIVGFLGIAAAAICAPLNPSYTAAEFEFFLADLQPRLLILEAGLSPPVRNVARRLGIPIWEFAAGSASVGEFAFGVAVPGAVPCGLSVTADDTALVLHTSGTTSRPKMVPLTHGNLCHSAVAIARALNLTPGDRCLDVMPLFHIHGLVGGVLSTLVSGGSAVCVEKFAAVSFFDWLEEFRPSWYTAVPAIHAAVLARADHMGFAARSCTLRFIRSCSAPLPLQTAARLEALFGVPVVEAYGMTEASHQITCNPLPPGQRKAGSVGIVTGTEVAVVDTAGSFLKSGEAGEIVVRGPSVTSGYIGDPAVTADSFFEDWLRTGDLGWLDEAGYLFISGRIKEIINRGGEKILPGEVEAALRDHPDVIEVVAFAVADARLGEDVGVAIVLRPGAKQPDRRSLREFAATRLALFKLPRHIAFVKEIPRGPTGKPQRIGLAERLGEASFSFADRVADNASRSGLRMALTAIWCETLRLETIDVHDDFFELGGDSAAAVAMLSKVQARHDVTLAIADLLNAPTIALFSELIARTEARENQARVAVIQRGAARPPFFGIGAGPRFRELAKLLGPDQPFVAPVYPDPADLPRPCRIEDIARYHVRSIRNLQRTGPYFLGGWCIDGLVAFEVAQQLKAAGEAVALLVLFDASLNSDLSDISWLASGYALLRAGVGSVVYHLWMMARQPNWKSRLDYASRHLRRIGERIRYQRLYYRFHFRGGSRGGSDGWREVSAVQHRVAAKYKPQPYDGEVLLLHRSARRWIGARVQRAWKSLLRGPLEIHEIPGDHGDMFDHPYVVVTAQKLRVKLRS